MNYVSSINDYYSDGLRPDPILTVDQWADKYRFLSQKAAAEPGKWRTSRTPYLKEIMQCLSSSSQYEKIVFMKPVQIGATECGANWLGYIIHHSPAPVMIVWPTIDMARRNSKLRVAPLIEDSEILRKLIAPPRERDSGNTVLSKEFRGGTLAMTGANSSVGLRSMPVRFLFLDEVDAYPLEVGEEGDAVALAEARTTTFVRRKIFLTSTPTTEENSKILKEYENTDKRKYFVPCPKCNKKQTLNFKNLIWTSGETKDVHYKCEFCKHKILNKDKQKMLEKGQWEKENPDSPNAGFYINGLYSPWLNWKTIADKIAEAKKASKIGDYSKLKTFVNTILAEPWKEGHKQLDYSYLIKRVEYYRLRTLPEKVGLITMGVDVQDDRLEYLIVGWGKGQESWILDWNAIYGSPASPTIWRKLYEVISTPIFSKKNGGELNIAVTAIDSGGHHTQDVYNFCRVYARRHVIAVHGLSTRNALPIGRPSYVDLNWKGEQIKKGAKMWSIGTDTIKDILSDRFKVEEYGKGFIHFSNELTPDFFKQLTSEYVSHTYKKGVRISNWMKKAGVRNEALDCFVYAIAAGFYRGMNRFHDKDWENLINKRAIKKEEPKNKIKAKKSRKINTLKNLRKQHRLMQGL